MNKSGELGSPCFNLTCELKKRDLQEWYLIHDFTTVYIEHKALTNLTLTSSLSNFCHNRDLSILSNAFS